MKLTSIILNGRILVEIIYIKDMAIITYENIGAFCFVGKLCHYEHIDKVLKLRVFDRLPNCKIESVELDLNSTPLFNYIQLINSAKRVPN